MAVQISGNDITVPRDGTFTRNVTIGGTLTYEDVTNIDSVGLITARTGIEIGARPGVAASISVDGNMIVSGISTFGGDVQVPDSKLLVGTDTARQTRAGNASYQPDIQLESSVAGLSLGKFNDSSGPARLTLQKARGSQSSPTIVQDNDEIGSLTFSGWDGDTFTNAAQIRSEVDGTPGDDDMPGNLIFYTTPDGSSVPSERLRIDSNGLLLHKHSASRTVGTKTGQIQVINSGNDAAISIIQTNNAASAPFLAFGKTRSANTTGSTIVQDGDSLGQILFAGADGTDIDSTGALITAQVDGTPGSNDMPGRLVFSTTADGATTSTERLRISSSGAITATLGSANSDNFNIQGHASQGRTVLKLIAGNADSTASTSLRLVRSNGNTVLSLSVTHNSDNGNIINQTTGGAIKFQVNESGSSLVRHVMTHTGHFVNCRGTSGRIAFGTADGVLYSGMGRYDGAAQDVGLSLYATTNAGTTFVEHFRMTHNGTLTATDTSIGSLSDSRLKKNIADYSYDISKFKQFKPKTFDWINPEVHGDKTSVKGFTAQDIELIDSDWVEETFVSKDDPDFSLISDTTTTNGVGETVGVSKASKFGYKDAMYISVIQQLISRIETLEGS